MENTALQIGDRVIRKGVPQEILVVEEISIEKGLVYMSLDGIGVADKIENVVKLNN